MKYTVTTYGLGKMGADLPNMRGEFRLAFDRSANGPETTARICAVSFRFATGRVPAEARPLRFAYAFAYVQGTMKSDKRWTEQ